MLIRLIRLTLKKNGYGWIRRHTLTMFQGHGESLPKGPTERSTSHTRIYGRVRGL